MSVVEELKAIIADAPPVPRMLSYRWLFNDQSRAFFADYPARQHTVDWVIGRVIKGHFSGVELRLTDGSLVIVRRRPR